MTTLALGSATADITPTWPLTLAGFAARTEPSQGISHPLRVRVSVLESRTETNFIRAVVVVADLLWWGQQDVATLRAEIAAIAGTTADLVLLSATHTHSGPQTAVRTSREIGVVDPRFTTLLHDQVLDATRQAIRRIEPVNLRRFTGHCHIGFNRRHDRNPSGPTDPRLTVLRFDRSTGAPAALWAHFACHPVITQEPLISSEYCGVAMDLLEERLGVTASFLQGCCGDINPVALQGGESLCGTDREVVATGERLAAAVEQLLSAADGDPLDAVPLTAHERSVELPFAPRPDPNTMRKQATEAGVRGELARALLDHPAWNTSAVTLDLQRLDIAQGCSLLAMNGEIVVEYGGRIRAQSGDTVLPLGYANGMTGYVPTARIIAEGGYEAGEAAPYFLLPAPFAPEVEARMDAAIASMLSA